MGTVRAAVRSPLQVPVTLVYLSVLAAVTLTLRLTGTRAGAVAFASTNLDNLGRHPVAALVCSAFVVGSPSLFMAVLVGVPMAVAERLLGWRRAVRAFVLGHVGATLLVAVGLVAAVGSELMPAAVEHASDVGVSYAAFALLAVIGVRLRRRWAVPVLLGTVGYLLVAVVTDLDFTEVGHCCAFALGAGYVCLLRRRGPRGG